MGILEVILVVGMILIAISLSFTSFKPISILYVIGLWLTVFSTVIMIFKQL